MIPGVPQDLLAGNDEDASRRLKRMMIITDSMTAAELDSDGMCFMQMDATGKEPVSITWRVSRVAKGSGASVREVEELLCQYRMMANMAKQAGGKNGWYGSFTCRFLCRFLSKYALRNGHVLAEDRIQRRESNAC